MPTKILRPLSLKDVASELEPNENPSLFLSEIDEWIGDDKIIYHKNNMTTKGNILIITQTNEQWYSIYRCFMLNKNWVCSVDVQEKELWEIFSNILK